jgi:cytochrome c biogenesis protein
LEEQKVTPKQVQKPGGGPFKAVWDFFASVKLTVILLIVLALVSIIGTVIDQTEPAKNLQMLAGMFGPANAQGALELLVKSGLTNMYHSWWFVGLLSMLTANIFVCTIERLPRTIAILNIKQEPLTDESLKSVNMKDEKRMKADASSAKEKAKAALRSMGYKPQEAEVDGEIHLYAEKGKFTRLGVYVVHASILVVFVGALIGSFWGYKAYVQIMEGQAVDAAQLTNKPLLRKLGDEVPLGFQVRCDKFELETYASGMPSGYYSTLTVIDGGKEVAHKRIRVNDPLDHKSIRFFQSSYGPAPGNAILILGIAPKQGGEEKFIEVKQGGTVPLEGTPYFLNVGQVFANVVMGPEGPVVEGNEYEGSSGANVVILDKDKNVVETIAALQRFPSQEPKSVPFNIHIGDYKVGPGAKYYTGLQVTYDPGVWIVWIGCILMVLGILIAFFTSHKRVWIRIKPSDKSASTVTIAGSVNKNKYGFEADFKKLVEKVESR